MALPQSIPATVLAEFGLSTDQLRLASSGLINRTWYARSHDDELVVIQRVNPIFPPEINADIDILTRHLKSKNVLSPALVPSRSGRLWLEHEGAIWRVLTYINGVTHDAVESPHRAAEAARALAQFHRAVSDLDCDFEHARVGVHDTTRHLEALSAALTERNGHDQYAAVLALATELRGLAVDLAELPEAEDRIVHGDPKIDNFLFDSASNRALCLIDLDTVTRMPISIELGDALRSWCNPTTEDASHAEFSLELFEVAVNAYAKSVGGLLTTTEWHSIPDATFMITIELAARFCADALVERYFAWDRERFGSASEHNQARTRGQLNVAQGVRHELPAMRDIVESAFVGAASGRE